MNSVCLDRNRSQITQCNVFDIDYKVICFVVCISKLGVVTYAKLCFILLNQCMYFINVIILSVQ